MGVGCASYMNALEINTRRQRCRVLDVAKGWKAKTTRWSKRLDRSGRGGGGTRSGGMRGVSEVGSVVADKREGDHKRLMRIHAPELGAQKKNRPPTFDSGTRIVHFTQRHSLDTVISSPPLRTAQNRLNIQPWGWGVLCCIAKEQSRVAQETRLIAE